MGNEPVSMGAAIQAVVAAIGGVVVAATNFSPQLDASIATLAVAVGLVLNIVFARPKVTPKSKTNTMGG